MMAVSAITDFSGEVAVVTGGGAGIGRATALVFARQGATVVVAGRGQPALSETVQLIEAEGGRASAAVTDVTVAEQVAGLVATTVERYGQLDIAFNNAGYFAPPAKVADLDEATWATMETSTQDPRIGFAPDEIDQSAATRDVPHKWVVVIDRDLPAGRAANAAVSVASATMALTRGVLGQDAVDADGFVHLGLPWIGCTVLGADASQLADIRARAAVAPGVVLAGMPPRPSTPASMRTICPPFPARVRPTCPTTP